MKRTKRLLSLAATICLALALVPFAFVSFGKANAEFAYTAGTEYDATEEYIVKYTSETYKEITVVPIADIETAAGIQTNVGFTGCTDSVMRIDALYADKAFVIEFKNSIKAADFDSITLKMGALWTPVTVEAYNVNEISCGALGEKKAEAALESTKANDVTLKLSDYANASGTVEAILFKVTNVTGATENGRIYHFFIDGFTLTEGFKYTAGTGYDATADYIVAQTATSYKGITVTPFTNQGVWWDSNVLKDSAIGTNTFNAANLVENSVVVLEFKNAIKVADFGTIEMVFGTNGGATFEVYNVNEISEGALGAAKASITLEHWVGTKVELNLSDYADGNGAVSAIAFKQVTAPLNGASVCELAFSGFTLNERNTAHTITFVADGVTVGTADFNEGDTSVTEPAIPAKEGYTAVCWEKYVLGTEDITVNAVYSYNYTANTEYDVWTTARDNVKQQSSATYKGIEVVPFGEKNNATTIAPWFGDTATDNVYLTAGNALTSGKMFVIEFNGGIKASDFDAIKIKIATLGATTTLDVYNVNDITNGAVGTVKETVNTNSVINEISLTPADYADENGIVEAILFKTNADVIHCVLDSFTLAAPIVVTEIETDIEKVVFNDTGDNSYLFIYPATSDYPEQFGNGSSFQESDLGVNCNISAADALATLNTFDYIKVNGTALSALNITDKSINAATRLGCFGLYLSDFSTAAADRGDVKYVEIKAGCEIPSYGAVKNGDNTVYVVKKDLTFVYSSYRGEWVKYTSEKAVNLAVGDTLPTLTNAKNEIFLGWELEGKLYKAGTAAVAAGTYLAVYYGYALTDGAYIRLADTAEESGIRFEAVMNQASLNELGSYIAGAGVIVMPTDLIGSAIFDAEHSGDPAVFYADKEAFVFTDGTMNVRCTIKTIKETNYNRSYSGRAFLNVTYADGTTESVYGNYDEEFNSRNIYDIAVAAYNSLGADITEAQRSVLEGYIGKVASVTVDYENKTVTIDSSIATPATAAELVSVADGVVTLKITSATKPLLFCNGEAIRGNVIVSESFESGVYTVAFTATVDEGLTFYCSEEALSQFLQDYYELYSAAGTYAVTHGTLGGGYTYQADWFSNASAWFNATQLSLYNEKNSSATYSADNYTRYYLNNIDIDKHGNVYNYYNDSSPDKQDGLPAYSTVTPAKLMPGQGWALPYSELEGFSCYHSEFNSSGTSNDAAKDDYSGITDEALKAEFLAYAKAGSYDYKEGDGRTESSKNWKVNGTAVTLSNGVALYSGAAKSGISNATGAANAIVYEVTGISFSAYNAPFAKYVF